VCLAALAGLSHSSAMLKFHTFGRALTTVAPFVPEHERSLLAVPQPQ